MGMNGINIPFFGSEDNRKFTKIFDKGVNDKSNEYPFPLKFSWENIGDVDDTVSDLPDS